MNNFVKIQFTGKINVKSGLHIGGSTAFAAIGAVDSPIIKDTLTNLPIIPGSTIKGKMRSLLAKAYNEKIAQNPNQDNIIITRLFGATVGGGPEGKNAITARLLFRDAFLDNKDELDGAGLRTYTEIKFENTIDRITAEAKPRQIERAIHGSRFGFELMYEVDDSSQIKKDLEMIIAGIKLIETDYLGGNGSRGYGKVKFESLEAETVFGDYDVTNLNAMLEG